MSILKVKKNDMEYSILCSYKNGVWKENVREILYFRRTGSKILMRLVSEEDNTIREKTLKCNEDTSLSYIFQMLNGDFCYANRSDLINVNRIAGIGEEDVQLEDGSRIGLSRRCRQNLIANILTV